MRAGTFISAVHTLDAMGDPSAYPVYQEADALHICKPSSYVFNRLPGIHLHIHYFSGNSFTQSPSPGACVLCSEGPCWWCFGMKLVVFLTLALHLWPSLHNKTHSCWVWTNTSSCLLLVLLTVENRAYFSHCGLWKCFCLKQGIELNPPAPQTINYFTRDLTRAE